VTTTGLSDGSEAGELATPQAGEATPGASSGAPGAAVGDDLRVRLERGGWRQGAVVRADHAIVDALKILPFAEFDRLPEPCWLIVASQDCDAVCDSLAVEPGVEVLIAEPIERMRTAHRDGRHPRELHLMLRGPEGEEQPVRVQVRNRAMFDRSLLAECSPATDYAVPTEYIEQIAGLLGGRYARIAYPSAFDARTRKARQQLARVLERYADDVVDIYFALHPHDQELQETEEYRLSVYAVVIDDLVVGDPRVLNELKTKLAKALREPLRKCSGVHLEKVSVVGRDEVTLREFMGMMPANLAE
jgi:hypothetical protein